jgi:hypothetical protein
MTPRFTTRILLAAMVLVAIAAAVGASGNVGALATVSLAAALPVVAVGYAAIKHEQASWAIWIFWPVLAAGIFGLVALWFQRLGGT